MMLKGVMMSLAIGYVLCVVAKKQQGVLKSLGYAIGIAILVLSIANALVCSGMKCPMMDKMASMCGMKGPQTMQR